MEEVYLRSAPDKVLGVPCYPESESLFKPYGPVYTRRVFNKAQVVQYPDGLFLYISLSSKKVYKVSEIRPIQLNGKCIDSKVPPVKVFFYGGYFNLWQGRRVFIIFRPCSCNIYFESVGKNDYCSAEFLMTLYPCPCG